MTDGEERGGVPGTHEYGSLLSPAPAPAVDRTAISARVRAVLGDRTWRTRFAPAPTGALHLGHAVSAVWVWSLARAYGGAVILRIEDHDQQRARPAYVDGILQDLAWLGLRADNETCRRPTRYLQTEQSIDRYTAALDALTASHAVYACRCSRRMLVDAPEPQDSSGERRYPGTCRDAHVPSGETPARRVRVRDAVIAFVDCRHGALTQIPAAQCGDVLVRDRLGQWTYQFAVTVDDLHDAIDLVIRGDDLLASTGRQWHLRELLGGTQPLHCVHHPLMHHPDGTKLSKSRGDTGLSELRAIGWRADEVLGYAAWLGGLQPERRPLDATALHTLWTG
jgi:glutamyl-Q tRNA(Asp) synthetase